MTSSPASTSRLNSKRLDQLGVRPAALEVRRAVDPGVGRAVEGEVVGQELLDDAAVAGLVGAVGVARELQAVLAGHTAYGAPSRQPPDA